MSFIAHILKFIGLLWLIGIGATYIPYGTFIVGCILLIALWKLTE